MFQKAAPFNMPEFDPVSIMEYFLIAAFNNNRAVLNHMMNRTWMCVRYLHGDLCTYMNKNVLIHLRYMPPPPTSFTPLRKWTVHVCVSTYFRGQQTHVLAVHYLPEDL